jgi:hypothetical protein
LILFSLINFRYCPGKNGSSWSNLNVSGGRENNSNEHHSGLGVSVQSNQIFVNSSGGISNFLYLDCGFSSGLGGSQNVGYRLWCASFYS